MERFAYLTANLLLLPIVIFFFWKRPDLRQKILTMGLVASPLGPISEFWFLKDYWRPQYALGWPWIIEDFLFSFICGSSSTVVYQVFFGKTLGERIYKRRDYYLFFLIPFGIINMAFLNNILTINSIFASAFTLLTGTVIMLYSRRDLIKISVATGTLIGLIAFVFYLLVLPLFPNILARTWLLYNKPLGKTIIGIPLTELIWAISLGFAAGPVYEFWQGYTVVPLNSSKTQPCDP